MVNVDIERSLGTIVKYLLFVNVVYFIAVISFKFYGGLPFFAIPISLALINVIMLSLYKLFVKYEYMIAGVIGANRLAKKIDNFAGRING